MGKNLEKKHLLFAIETSNFSKTDTVLQSLLGRICGYSEGSDRVIVYLSNKIVEGNDIENYINLWEEDGIEFIPEHANNIVSSSTKHKTYAPIIPIRISIDRTKYPTNKRRHLLKCLADSFENDENVTNKNSEDAYDEVRFKVRDGMLKTKKPLNCHYADKNKEHQLTKMREIINAYETATAREFGSGCGIDSNATEVKYWIVKEDVVGFDLDVMYVTAKVDREYMGLDELSNIPSTTKKEVFAHRLEDDSEIKCNGGMTIKLSSHTANDETAMSNELSTMIDTSLKITACERKITSCWDGKMKEFKGILVSSSIYKKLQKDGSIYKMMHQKYGVNLHVCKTRGRISTEVAELGLIKLASISW